MAQETERCGEPMPVHVPLPIGTALPQAWHTAGGQIGGPQLSPPCPCLLGNAGPCRDRLSIPEHLGPGTHPIANCDLGTKSLNAYRKCRRKSPGQSPRSWIGRWRKVAPRRKPSPWYGPLPGRTDRGEWKPLVRRHRRISGTLSSWRQPGPVTAENYGCSSMWRR